MKGDLGAGRKVKRRQLPATFAHTSIALLRAAGRRRSFAPLDLRRAYEKRDLLCAGLWIVGLTGFGADALEHQRHAVDRQIVLGRYP